MIMDDKTKPELDPDRLAEKLGVPMPGPVDPLTYNTNLIGMYKKAAGSDINRPLWVRVLAIAIGFLFLLPSIFYASILIGFIKENGIQIFISLNNLLILFWLLLLLTIGLKIIFKNIKNKKIK